MHAYFNPKRTIFTRSHRHYANRSLCLRISALQVNMTLLESQKLCHQT